MMYIYIDTDLSDCKTLEYNVFILYLLQLSLEWDYCIFATLKFPRAPPAFS